MLTIIQKIFNKLFYNRDTLLRQILINQGKILCNMSNNRKITSLEETEFKIFSQFGEDGIIQYLIDKLPIKNKVFIEFGIEDYSEANTRFLLENDNWSGLVLDSSANNINYIKNSNFYWKYDLLAKELFITKDNIDNTIAEYLNYSRFNKEIGLLSIDIDGNDYHIWKSIKSISPIIVICEYNWIFGNKLQLTVPYDDNFLRTKKHYSNLYFGASIQALYSLAKSKGYEYIGCTEAGNDAFFVKKEYAKKYIKELITTPIDSFNKLKARQSLDKDGNLTYIRGKQQLNLIKEMELINIETNTEVKLKSLIESKEL